MKKISNILWGVVLIAAGVIFALNALEITSINVFFKGWWTLFIIIPCTVGLFTEREKTGNIIGLALGVCLLLGAQGVLSFALIWKLLIPAIIVVVGIKMVVFGIFGNKARDIINKVKANGGNTKSCCATFSGSKLNYDCEVFEGAELDAVFGGVECDLTNAIIEKDCAIDATAIFGGINIRVPENINVTLSSNSIFGGVSNKTEPKEGVPTVYIKCTCVFGGINIK